MLNRILNLGKKTSDIPSTQPVVDAAELQRQHDLNEAETFLIEVGAIFNSLNDTIRKSDPSPFHKLQKSDAKQLTEKRQKDVVTLKFPKMKMHFSNLSALLSSAIHAQVQYRAQMKHYIHSPEQLAEVCASYRLMLKEFDIKSRPIIELIGQVRILFSDKIQDVSKEVDLINHVKIEMSELVKEGAYFCQDAELKQLALQVEQESQQQEILLKEKKDLLATILSDGTPEDAHSTMNAIREKNEIHSKKILEKTRLLEALHKQACVRVNILRDREEATTDFMQAIYQNFLTVADAYGSEILRFNGGCFDNVLDDEANKILSEIAKRIREDNILLKLNKDNVIDANRSLRNLNNLTDASPKEINEAKKAHLAPYRTDFKKMNKLYKMRLYKLIDSDLPDSEDVKKIIDDLQKKILALGNTHSLPTMEHWTELAAAEIEIEKIVFVLNSIKFFNTIVAWQDEVLTHAHSKSYVEKYIELKNRVNDTLPTIEEWTKSTNRKQLLAVAKAKMNAIGEDFAVTMEDDKVLIETRRAKREKDSRPIQVFCTSLAEQIKLLQADPASADRDEIIALLTSIIGRFEMHRNRYLQKVLGDKPDQQSQHVIFCRDAEKILMNELNEKNGLAKITDLVLRSKFKALVRDLFEPVHQMICRSKGVKYSPRLFATWHEKQLAKSAQELSKGLLEYSELGNKKRWTGISPLSTKFASA